MELITNPAGMAFAGGILGAAAKDVLKDFTKDFIYSVINRCTGKQASKRIEKMEQEGKLETGDLAALVDAIEPAMRDAHRVIGAGATNILIIQGDKNVVHLNAATKDYVNSALEDTTLLQGLFNVASFNANTGNGRVFDYTAGRTVPFILDQSADSPL